MPSICSQRASHRPGKRVRIEQRNLSGNGLISCNLTGNLKAARGMNVSRKLETFLITAPFIMAAAIFVLLVAGDRMGLVAGPRPLVRSPVVLPGLAVVMIVDAMVLAALGYRRRRKRKKGPGAALTSGDLSRAVEVQAKRAGAFIDRVSDPARRRATGAASYSRFRPSRRTRSVRWRWSSSGPSRPARPR